MEVLSSPLKPVLRDAGDQRDGMVMGVHGAAGTGAHTAMLQLLKLLLISTTRGLLYSALLSAFSFFSLCFYRKSQFPQIIQAKSKKGGKKYKCVIAFSSHPRPSLSHTGLESTLKGIQRARCQLSHLSMTDFK